MMKVIYIVIMSVFLYSTTVIADENGELKSYLLSEDKAVLDRYMLYREERTAIEQNISLSELKLKKLKLDKSIRNETISTQPIKNTTAPRPQTHIALPNLNILSRYIKNKKQYHVISLNGKRFELPIIKYIAFTWGSEKYELFDQDQDVKIRRAAQ